MKLTSIISMGITASILFIATSPQSIAKTYDAKVQRSSDVLITLPVDGKILESKSSGVIEPDKDSYAFVFRSFEMESKLSKARYNLKDMKEALAAMNIVDNDIELKLDAVNKLSGNWAWDAQRMHGKLPKPHPGSLKTDSLNHTMLYEGFEKHFKDVYTKAQLQDLFKLIDENKMDDPNIQILKENIQHYIAKSDYRTEYFGDLIDKNVLLDVIAATFHRDPPLGLKLPYNPNYPAGTTHISHVLLTENDSLVIRLDSSKTEPFRFAANIRAIWNSRAKANVFSSREIIFLNKISRAKLSGLQRIQFVNDLVRDLDSLLEQIRMTQVIAAINAQITPVVSQWSTYGTSAESGVLKLVSNHFSLSPANPLSYDGQTSNKCIKWQNSVGKLPSCSKVYWARIANDLVKWWLSVINIVSTDDSCSNHATNCTQIIRNGAFKKRPWLKTEFITTLMARYSTYYFGGNYDDFSVVETRGVMPAGPPKLFDFVQFSFNGNKLGGHNSAEPLGIKLEKTESNPYLKQAKKLERSYFLNAKGLFNRGEWESAMAYIIRSLENMERQFNNDLQLWAQTIRNEFEAEYEYFIRLYEEYNNGYVVANTPMRITGSYLTKNDLFESGDVIVSISELGKYQLKISSNLHNDALKMVELGTVSIDTSSIFPFVLQPSNVLRTELLGKWQDGDKAKWHSLTKHVQHYIEAETKLLKAEKDSQSTADILLEIVTGYPLTLDYEGVDTNSKQEVIDLLTHFGISFTQESNKVLIRDIVSVLPESQNIKVDIPSLEKLATAIEAWEANTQ